MNKIIALDIGGTNFRVALINEDSTIEKINITNSKIGNVDDFLNQAKNAIMPLINNDVIAISIGVPGRVKSDGYIYALPNMHIKDIDLANFLKECFNKQVFIKNDAEMAALGEKVLGVGKNHSSLYFITISTGLGGAMCQGNQNVLSSSEIGHTIIKYKNKLCEYEGLLSGSGIVKLAKMNHLKIKDSKELFDLKKQNNEKAINVYKEWLILMNDFLHYIDDMFSPEIIAITGGVMKSKDSFFAELQIKSKLPIAECELGQNAGLYGAFCYAMSKIKQDD